jgi:hypothetical protein
MRLFLKKLGLYILLPVFIWGLIEAILPVTTFTHRHFEATSFRTSLPKQTVWYPNINSKMNAVGDLCHHSKYAIRKEEIWRTDNIGFRNDAFISNPDILIVGDSFVIGSGLTQDETLTNQMKSRLKDKWKVYNLSTCTFSDYIKYYNDGIFKKPKLIIFSIVERNVPEKIETFRKTNKIKRLLIAIFKTGNFNVYLDKALKLFSLEWLRARVQNAQGKGIRGISSSNMFFQKGRFYKHKTTDLNETANAIISYKKYCDSLGINFLFLPMPNKETVYYDLVPLTKQPDYLFKLDSILQNAKVNTLNTQKIYTDYRKTETKLLYHLDDTHWNATATALISNQILQKITPSLDSTQQKKPL